MSKLSGQILETKICITDSWIHVNEYAYKLKKTQISNPAFTQTSLKARKL